MEPVAAPAPEVLHPRAAAFTVEARGVERRIGLLFAATGIALIAVMGVLGLIMRLTQATVIHLSPAWFYRLLTLHGAGMITGSLLAMMGALWYVLHASVPLRPGRMLATYALTLAGALAVLVATLVGGFGAGWAFLPPLPFYPAGQWSVWSESLFFVGLLLVGAGLRRLLHRRARADDRPPTAGLHARSACSSCAAARSEGAAAAGDRRHRRRDRRAARRGGRDDDPGRAARAHLRPHGRHRRPGREEPRLLLRPLDRQPDDLPRRRRDLRARAPLRRPPLRDDQGVRRRLDGLARLHRHRLLAPPVHGLRPADLGRHHLRDRLLRRGDPGRGDHDLLDDDARLGLPLPVDARLDAALRRLRRLGDRRHRRGDRLDHPDQLPPPQHRLGRRPLPHLPDPDRRRLGARLPRPPARTRRRPDLLAGRRAPGRSR